MAFKCPHCDVVVSCELKSFEVCSSKELRDEFEKRGYSFSAGTNSVIKHIWNVLYYVCVSCGNPIVYIQDFFSTVNGTPLDLEDVKSNIFRIFPKAINKELSDEIPENYRNYFKEAYSVLNLSPAASAALSRRILQLLLVEKAGVKDNGNLKSMIDEVVNSRQLPSYLADDIDKVKEIGNYAAHPNKSDHLSEIIDVEPGEAEWSLDILEGLFDFYFVQPIKAQKRRDEWNNKTKKKS